MTTPMMRVLLAVTLAAAVGCSDSSTGNEAEEPPVTGDVVPRGDRLLGIAISDRSDGDFNAAYLEAVDAGMQFTSLSLQWDGVETAPGVYAPDPNFLEIAAAFYAPRGTRLILALNPIDTNNRRVPPHLAGRSWDDPVVVDAFKELLDWALDRAAPLDLVALAIGNEIDGTLASVPEWEAWGRFFQEVAAHARSIRPGLVVGTKITVGGLRGPFAGQASALVDASDAVLTTYYPLASDFRILPPETVGGVFDDLVARFPDRPILFTEIGSSSTQSCGSSEASQAEFVRQAFAAWDRHAARIQLLEFVWMHDISQAQLDIYESYYGVSNRCFLEYLGTLGLKRPDGRDKAAWGALVEEAERRGW